MLSISGTGISEQEDGSAVLFGQMECIPDILGPADFIQAPLLWGGLPGLHALVDARRKRSVLDPPLVPGSHARVEYAGGGQTGYQEEGAADIPLGHSLPSFLSR